MTSLSLHGGDHCKTPCDWSLLPSQSVSRKCNQEKKKATFLCAPRELLKKMCWPCLMIIQSCYSDYRMNKAFTCSHCVICISCSVNSILTFLRMQRIIGFFILITQKWMRSGNHISRCIWGCSKTASTIKKFPSISILRLPRAVLMSLELTVEALFTPLWLGACTM